MDTQTRQRNAIQLVADDPGSPAGHRAWGHALLEQQQFDDAVESFKTAVRLDPHDPSLYFELASALIARTERQSHTLRASGWTTARDVANAGLRLDPGSSIGTALVDLAEERRLVDSLENGEKPKASRRRRRARSHLRIVRH